ncbi:MAG TPA: 3-ketoacyl-ACP reductase [Flavitalea sp.]|nr:3-ketoacyl-ACP reductase [Flavitalea sp.]
MMKQVALITGGSRGIGYGIALQLAVAGYDLVINGVREATAVSDQLKHLEDTGARVLYCQADISSAADRQRMLDDINAFYGRLDILINNAGIAPRERKDILEASEESFSELINTNLKGPYFLTQSVARWMIVQKDEREDFNGCIINISSISAVVASVNRGEYCIAKAGVSMATQLFAVRLADYNIPVYEVRPGIIHTDMTAGVTEKYDRLIKDGLTLQKRWGSPEDVGKAVAALAGANFPYSTGQIINVEGGMLTQRL